MESPIHFPGLNWLRSGIVCGQEQDLTLAWSFVKGDGNVFIR